jgi:acyl-CoA thioesterase
MVIMVDIREFFVRDRFASHSGVELLEVTPGGAKARMRLEGWHQNGLGSVHGGAIFTLADLAFAAACNSHGTVAVAVNANIYYVKAATSGTLYADARETSLGGKIATYAIDVTDEKGALIATFQGLAYRKKERLEELA